MHEALIAAFDEPDPLNAQRSARVREGLSLSLGPLYCGATAERRAGSVGACAIGLRLLEEMGELTAPVRPTTYAESSCTVGLARELLLRLGQTQPMPSAESLSLGSLRTSAMEVGATDAHDAHGGSVPFEGTHPSADDSRHALVRSQFETQPSARRLQAAEQSSAERHEQRRLARLSVARMERGPASVEGVPAATARVPWNGALGNRPIGALAREGAGRPHEEEEAEEKVVSELHKPQRHGSKLEYAVPAHTEPATQPARRDAPILRPTAHAAPARPKLQLARTRAPSAASESARAARPKSASARPSASAPADRALAPERRESNAARGISDERSVQGRDAPVAAVRTTPFGEKYSARSDRDGGRPGAALLRTSCDSSAQTDSPRLAGARHPRSQVPYALHAPYTAYGYASDSCPECCGRGSWLDYNRRKTDRPPRRPPASQLLREWVHGNNVPRCSDCRSQRASLPGLAGRLAPPAQVGQMRAPGSGDGSASVRQHHIHGGQPKATGAEQWQPPRWV
jgi:hypothetical protein